MMLAIYFLLRQGPLITEDLPEPQPSGVLKVSIRNNSMGMIDEQGQWAGMEYELLTRFANKYNYQLELIPTANYQEMLSSILEHKAHFAAANISVTLDRMMLYRFSQPYEETLQLVLYNALDKQPSTLDELDNKIVVLKYSNYASALREFKQVKPDFSWGTRNTGIDDILTGLNDGDIKATIIDANLYRYYRRFYPNIRIAFQLNDVYPIAWAFPRDRYNTLLTQANEFINNALQNGLIEQLKSQYFSHLDNYDQAGSLHFMKLVQQRLPEYIPLFRKIAEKYEMDWRLLAAIAYQESHWNPKAISPTGVRGLMMLTLTTAKQVKVKNRLDPEQSVRGAAMYLKKLEKKIPERIQSPDRLWMALAAYNLGFRHLETARILTQRSGDNPDHWHDIKKHLPRLNKLDQVKKIKRRPASGRQAAEYVEKIKSYYEMLVWLDQREQL